MISATPSDRISAARLAPFSISSAVTEDSSPLTIATRSALVVSVWNGVSVSGRALMAAPQDTAAKVSSTLAYTAPSSLENSMAPFQGGSK